MNIISSKGVIFEQERAAVYRAIDASTESMAAEAKSIEDGKRFAGKNDKFHDPPIPFSQLLTLKSRFGFVRDVIDKKVDHAITELALGAQADEPNMKQRETAQHFLDTAGGELSLREVFKRAMSDRLSMGPGLVETTRIVEGAAPSTLKHAPAYTFRKGLNGLWAQAVRIQREDLTGYDDRKIWFQPFGSDDKGKVVRKPDGKIKLWRFVDPNTGQPMPSGFTKDRFVQSANELKVFYGYDSCSPQYGLPDFYGAISYLEIIELITDRFNNRLRRTIPAQLLLVDSDGLNGEGVDPSVEKLEQILNDIADKGKADVGIFGVKPGEGNRKGIDTVDLSSGLKPEELERIFILAVKMVLVTMGTPASVANMVFEKIGAINADTGQWQMKNWRDTELEPMRTSITDFLNALMRELGITDWAVEFTPMQKAPEDKKLDSERDEIDIRSGVKTAAEVREERRLSKAATDEGRKDDDKKTKSKADAEKPGSESGLDKEGDEPTEDATTEGKAERTAPVVHTRAAADDREGLSEDEWAKLDQDLDKERSKMAEALLALLILLPGADADLKTIDAAVADIAEQIVTAGAENIPAILAKYRPQIEKAFGVKLSDMDLAELAGAAKESWARVVRERWLGTQHSVDRLIESIGSEDPEALAAAAEKLEGKSFKKRLLVAAGVVLAIKKLEESMKHSAQSIAREATSRPAERMQKAATLKMEEEHPERLVEWRTRSYKPCPDCIELEASTAGGVRPSELKNTPGDGQTYCRFNCHCTIVRVGAYVRQQTEEEAELHQHDLYEAAKERKRKAKEEAERA